jgi:uncharacterized protein YprB with RNaseH-like and TPR domain
MNENKPWLNRDWWVYIVNESPYESDTEVARFLEGLGWGVSRRALTDARNKFGLKYKSEEVHEVEVVDLEPPKILFIDIETRPNLGYFWRMYDENIGLSQMVEEGQVISFAAKWRGVDETEFYSVFHDGHTKMVEEARRLLDEADFVLHWNGKRFDIPHLNKEFVLQELNPPSAYKQLDLMLTARSQFKFVSNKLQHVSTALGFDGKFEHEGFELWLKCMNEDAEAWEIMRKYNIQDVVLLEQIYDRILPWIRSHPNVPLYKGAGSCPQCGGSSIHSEGKAYLTTRTYEKFRCDDCGAQMRGTKFKDSAAFVPLSY